MAKVIFKTGPEPRLRRRTRQSWRAKCRTRWLGIGLMLGAIPLLTASYLVAQEIHPTESQVEAAYLFNFGKFVTWPADRVAASRSFEICILGKDPFGPVLAATVGGEHIGEKTITTRRLARVEQAGSCSILFVSSSEEDHLAFILTAADKLNLLTVSDIHGFADRGGMIGFVTQQKKIRFEINIRTAAQAHLLFSSQLLKVATKVVERNISGD